MNKPSADTQQEGSKEKLFQMKEGDEVVGYKFEEVERSDGRVVKKRYKIVKRPRQKYVWLTREEKREIGVIFNTFDKDKSGTIEVGELRDAMKALGLKMDKDQIKEVMDKADKDGSGDISPDEFLQHMASMIQKREVKDELVKVFRIYDDDDNGWIEYENLRKVADALYKEEVKNRQQAEKEQKLKE